MILNAEGIEGMFNVYEFYGWGGGGEREGYRFKILLFSSWTELSSYIVL